MRPVLVFISLLIPSITSAAMLVSADFEGGGGACPSGFTAQEKGNSLSVSTTRARSGSWSHQTILRHTDECCDFDKHRAECARNTTDPEGSERWYAVSIFLQSLPHDEVYEEHVQMLQNRGNWGGIKATNPDDDVLAINGLLTQNGAWYWRARDPNGGSYWDRLAPYQAGRWTDWVIHAKWSKGSDGFIKLWKDGQLVKTYRGPNLDPRVNGSILFKFGLYRPTWDTTKAHDQTARIVYHDAIRIGDGGESYASVAPSGQPAETEGDGPTPPPTPEPLAPPTNLRVIPRP